MKSFVSFFFNFRYKWYHMVFLFLWFTSLSMIISRSIHVAAKWHYFILFFLAYHSFNQLTFLEPQFSFNLDTCDPQPQKVSQIKKKIRKTQKLSLSSLLLPSVNLTASFPRSEPFSIILGVTVKKTSAVGCPPSYSKYDRRKDFYQGIQHARMSQGQNIVLTKYLTQFL